MAAPTHVSRRARGQFSPAPSTRPASFVLPEPKDAAMSYNIAHAARHRSPPRDAAASTAWQRSTSEQHFGDAIGDAGGDGVVVPRAVIEHLEKDHRELQALLAHHGFPPDAARPSSLASRPAISLQPPQQQQQKQQQQAGSAAAVGKRVNAAPTPRDVARHFMTGLGAAAASENSDEEDAMPTQRHQQAHHVPVAAFPGLQINPDTPTSPGMPPHKQMQLQQKVRSLDLEVARLEARASAAERQALSAERRSAELQANLEGKTQELRSASDRNRELARSLAEARDDIARLQAENAALHSTVEQSQRTSATRRHEAAASTDDARVLRRSLDDSRAAERGLREECDRLREKIARYQAYHEREAVRRRREGSADGGGGHVDDATDQQQHRATDQSAPAPTASNTTRSAAETAKPEFVVIGQAAPPPSETQAPPSSRPPKPALEQQPSAPARLVIVNADTVVVPPPVRTASEYRTGLPDDDDDVTAPAFATQAAASRGGRPPLVRHVYARSQHDQPSGDYDTANAAHARSAPQHESTANDAAGDAARADRRASAAMPWPDYHHARASASTSALHPDLAYDEPVEGRGDGRPRGQRTQWVPASLVLSTTAGSVAAAAATSGGDLFSTSHASQRSQRPVRYDGPHNIAWSRRAEDVEI
jgi:hypothetical protein